MGFVQLLFQGEEIAVIKKYRRIKEEKREKELYIYFYDKNRNYIIYNGKTHQISTKKDFFKILPNHRKQIKSFYKKNRSIRKSDHDNFLINMTRSIDELLQNKISIER